MPVVGIHESGKNSPLAASNIKAAMVLTYERPGLLTNTLNSLMEASPDLHIVVYDDGSTSPEKLRELDAVEAGGIYVNREHHRGLVRSWMHIFMDLHIALDLVYSEDDGVVLLEDDLVFAKGWDETLLKMGQGVAAMGLNPGAMTCLRCHEVPQSKIVDLNGVPGYQSMQHGFQVNMVPMGIFSKMHVFEEAAYNSEKGDHGIDIWFVGGLSHRLGLTSFMSEQSWAAHTGVGNTIAGKQGYVSFNGVGYNLVDQLSTIQDAPIAQHG